MIEAEAVTAMISNTGFPIACVIIMFRMWTKEREQCRGDNERWITAINNNTRMIERFIDSVKGED